MSESERLAYATAEPEERYRLAACTPAKTRVAESLVALHAGEPTLVIGQYLDQLDEIGADLDAPVIKGDTPVKERQRLFEAFRTGEITLLVVSKVANFSIDLPEAAVAIQVSGSFGSRQEEAQRLGRLLRPKADGRTARFYAIVSRDTVDAEFAQNRQRFLAEQGYAYRIIDAGRPRDRLTSADRASSSPGLAFRQRSVGTMGDGPLERVPGHARHRAARRGPRSSSSRTSSYGCSARRWSWGGDLLRKTAVPFRLTC